MISEKQKEYNKKYREAHKDQLREYAKQYRADHKAEIKVRHKEYMHNDYLKNKFKRDKVVIKWMKDNPERAKESRRNSSKNMREKYPDRMLSRIKANKIKIPFSQDCEECEFLPAIERHHEDYNKPYDVLFVCSPCNKLLG